MKRILILGAYGMLGSQIFKTLFHSGLDVFGTIHGAKKNIFPKKLEQCLVEDIDVYDFDSVEKIIKTIQPNIVINCIGIVKQKNESCIENIYINSLLPHKINSISSNLNFKFIHISTDCVFSGDKGLYIESDYSDARDLYGKSKFLGEPLGENSLTLRTSIIGHEVKKPNFGLLEWILSQEKKVYGYSNAYFSGVTTNELSIFINELIAGEFSIFGLYHISSTRISKYDLLIKIRNQYKLNLEIIPSDELCIDRSLISEKLKLTVGYSAPDWDDMLSTMYAENCLWKKV